MRIEQEFETNKLETSIEFDARELEFLLRGFKEEYLSNRKQITELTIKKSEGEAEMDQAHEIENLQLKRIFLDSLICKLEEAWEAQVFNHRNDDPSLGLF
jgi:hypothetical protein